MAQIAHKVKQLPVNICLSPDELITCQNLSSAIAVTAIALAKVRVMENAACVATKAATANKLGPALETVQHTWQVHSKDRCHCLLCSHPPLL